MTRIPLFALALSGLGAAPALAITPEELWAAWQATSALQGQDLAAESESRAGDTLALSGVTLTMEPEADGPTIEAEIGTVLMREAGDGTVAVTMADSYPVTLTGAGEDDEITEMTLRVTQPGFTIVASGTPEAIVYDIAGPTLTVALESLQDDAGEPVDAQFSVALRGITGRYSTTGTATQTIDSSFAAETLTVTVAAESTDGDTPGQFTFNTSTADLAARFNGTLVPELAETDDLGAMLKAGFAAGGGYALGATTFDFDFADGTDAASGAGTLASGSFDFAMDADRLDYRTATSAIDVTFSGSDMPFPELRVTLGELAFGFLIPVAQTAEPADFSILTRVVDLVLPDEVWAMGDPAGALPRGPLTVILDAVGKARMTADIFDPAAMEGDAPPGELHAVEVRELQVRAVGADLTGTGAFTFDNSDLVTFDGLPRPAGSMDLTLVGGNALLDTLAKMGLIPEDQVMGARMMLGLFARPGLGPDELVSKIEVTPTGEILANGQRIR